MAKFGQVMAKKYRIVPQIPILKPANKLDFVMLFAKIGRTLAVVFQAQEKNDAKVLRNELISTLKADESLISSAYLA